MKQLEKTAEKYAFDCQNEEGYPLPTYDSYDAKEIRECAFMAGARWQSDQSPWISVEEQLPETNNGQSLYEVIVATSDRIFQVVINTEVEHLVGLLGVTHWMPIPKFN